MPEFPARTVAVALSLETYAALETLAAITGEPVEAVAAKIFADTARLGTPADLRAAPRGGRRWPPIWSVRPAGLRRAKPQARPT